jgi:tetratricopeptide (TPR) repeat protein
VTNFIYTASIHLPGAIFLQYRQTVALYHLAQGDFDTAQYLLEESLTVGPQIEDKHGYNSAKHWIATCLYRKGCLIEARQWLHEAIREARQYGVQRGIFAHSIRLIPIDLDQENISEAAAELAKIYPLIEQYQDRRYIALIQRLYARLHTLQGDHLAARTSLTEAIDLFERLGMRRELAEAREELARLEAMIASDSSPAPA